MLVDKVRLSSAFLRGFSMGYRRAGYSLWRRFFLQIVVSVLLIGSSLGCFWAAADIFSRLRTGDSVHVVVLGKIAAWNRIYGPPSNSRVGAR